MTSLPKVCATRCMEIDALVTVVQEPGPLVGIATPYIDMVSALVRQRAIVAGCYQTRFSINDVVCRRLRAGGRRLLNMD